VTVVVIVAAVVVVIVWPDGSSDDRPVTRAQPSAQRLPSAPSTNSTTAVPTPPPDPVEVAAYYVVAEALTNAAKHAQASMVEVCADTEGQDLHLSIRADGIGGANAARGSGITGLRDRVEALGGTLSISSHPGTGTELRATIPFEAPPHPNGPIE
jgi:signal transduction histidine kinase